jgi:hypothetical protein
LQKLLLLLLLNWSVALPAQQVPQLTADQWRQDLRYFADQIRTHHRDPYHNISQADFDHAISDLESRIPSMKSYEVAVSLQALAAMIGDGHTFLDTHNLYRHLPIEVSWFGDELRVIRAAPPYRSALGAKIIRIGEVPIQDVQHRLVSVIPQHESRWLVLDKSAELITEFEPLAALHIITDSRPADFTFEDEAGKHFHLQLEPQSAVGTASLVPFNDHLPLPATRPDEPFWFTYIADAQSVYVMFRSYDGLEERSKPLWQFIQQHSPKRLIIDMRWNHGGDYTKGRQYLIYQIAYMPTLNRRGHLFVITGRRTFSAAMTNVTDFRRETEATILGEPTGARPNGFQENYWFTLPASKLRASCASLAYRFQPFADTEAVFPDVRIDPDWKLFRAGDDAALRWIRESGKEGK